MKYLATTRYGKGELHIVVTMYEKYADLLEKKGVTTYQVCKETGISQSAMANFKARSDKGAKLSFENVARLASYFDVDIEYFVDD